MARQVRSAGGVAAAYEVLSEGAPGLVRGIHAEALPHFARLLTAVVLQAAAAGEALLDKELTDLAQRNLAKFSRLNQRLQVIALEQLCSLLKQCCLGNRLSVLTQRSHTLGTCLVKVRPVKPLWKQASYLCAQGQGSTGKAAGAPARHGHQGSPGMSEASWGGARRSGAGAKRKGARDTCTGAEELAASSLEAAWRFSPAQRLFVLFLEAADSHRLTTCLIRCLMLACTPAAT